MDRYKKRGWFNDSHRHSLAAKGYSTRYNALKYNSFNRGTIPETAMTYTDENGRVMAYEDPKSGIADAESNEELYEAELTQEKPKFMKDLLDIPAEINEDIDVRSPFNITDAATGPGSLMKDAGGAFGDIVRFAQDLTGSEIKTKPYRGPQVDLRGNVVK